MSGSAGEERDIALGVRKFTDSVAGTNKWKLK